MTTSTSSAKPQELFRYADIAARIDADLKSEANRLLPKLQRFEASCTEYRVSVSHLPDRIQDHANDAAQIDRRVRGVGAEFQRADQIGTAQFGGETTFDFLKDIVVLERAARAGFLGGLRFRPYAGWLTFFRDAVFRLGYKGKWTVTGSRSALRAGGIAKNVRWFSYRYLNKQLTIKPGRLASEAKSILRKLPRNSPYLPVSTFKQRIADVFGVGRSLGGKLKSAAGIGILLTVGANVYEFGWGINRDLGLGSRQFVTATVADTSATLGIIAVSTAVGSLIPVPFLGTVAGFLVGVGLAYAYDKWGKDAWRDAVDGAGQKLENALDAASRDIQAQLYKEQRDLAREAADVAQQQQETPSQTTPAEPDEPAPPNPEPQVLRPPELATILTLTDGRQISAAQLDGITPVAGMDNTYGKPGQLPLAAPIASTADNRHPDLYDAVIDQFGVKNNPRYAQDDYTYCNTFSGDVARAMGVPFPTKEEYLHNSDRATIGFPDLYNWFNNQSINQGWRAIDPSTPEGLSILQEHINSGKPAFAVDSGHIAVIRPNQQALTAADLSIAQAGASNLNDVRLGDAGLGTAFKPRFFIHD